MKVTIKKALELQRICLNFSGSKTKFGYACIKNSKILEAALKDYNEALSDTNAKYCSVDKDKNMMVSDKGQYSFTIENKLKVEEWFRAEQQKEIEVDFYKALSYSDIQDDLFALELLNGYIIDVDIEKLLES